MCVCACVCVCVCMCVCGVCMSVCVYACVSDEMNKINMSIILLYNKKNVMQKAITHSAIS